MHVIKKATLVAFYEQHAESKSSLTSWYKIVKTSRFDDFNSLRRAFPQVDQVAGKYVFNIGRAYRLIAAIHFNTKKIFIRHILTHAEYDRGKWK